MIAMSNASPDTEMKVQFLDASCHSPSTVPLRSWLRWHEHAMLQRGYRGQHDYNERATFVARAHNNRLPVRNIPTHLMKLNSGTTSSTSSNSIICPAKSGSRECRNGVRFFHSSLLFFPSLSNLPLLSALLSTCSSHLTKAFGVVLEPKSKSCAARMRTVRFKSRRFIGGSRLFSLEGLS